MLLIGSCNAVAHSTHYFDSTYFIDYDAESKTLATHIIFATFLFVFFF